MPELPIPIYVALTLGYLFVQSLVRRDRPLLFAALIGLCAAQSVVIALGQHYGVAGFRMVQPVTAAMVPPLAWVTFRASAIRPLAWPGDAVHLIWPAFTAFCLVFAPVTLDYVVPGVFAGYGVLILRALRGGADGLPLTRLGAGESPGLIWRFAAVALIASALSDVLIAVVQAMGEGQYQPWIVSGFASANLLVLGALSLSRSLEGEAEPGEAPLARDEGADPARDGEVMAALGALIEGKRLYLDPGLTLGQLSRRLLIPVKTLSATINRATGENVSRYINRFRVDHACRCLEAGENVTSAMLSSGFNTKSNFNREFLRVTGRAPSEWRGAGTPNKDA